LSVWLQGTYGSGIGAGLVANTFGAEDRKVNIRKRKRIKLNLFLNKMGICYDFRAKARGSKAC